MKVVPADTKYFQIDFEQFTAMLNEHVAAVLINTPNNPSGIVYSTETVKRLADILREKSEESKVQLKTEINQLQKSIQYLNQKNESKNQNL